MTRPGGSAPVPVLVTYRPTKGMEAKLLALLKLHWPTLEQAGLVTPSEPKVWRATDKRTGRRYFVEMFTWKDARASDAAHRSPEVMAVWGPMEPLLESMDIVVVRPVAASSHGPALRPTRRPRRPRQVLR